MTTPDQEAFIPHVLLSKSSLGNGSIDDLVIDALRAIRLYLNMEVAFVSEFADGRRRFRYIDSDLATVSIAVGDSDPLEQSYCQRIVDGRFPQIIQDASALPDALALPITTALPVGAHISVPLRLGNGQTYGTFCCVSTRPDFTLSDRDLTLMRLFADFTARQISRQFDADQTRREMVQQIASVLEAAAFTLVYQPIVNLVDRKIIGFEALTRFWPRPLRSPDIWFAEAAKVGLSAELEMAAIAKALDCLDHVPEDIYLSINVSPENVLNGAVDQALQGVPRHRIVLEVTEHVAIPDYAQFGEQLTALRCDRGQPSPSSRTDRPGVASAHSGLRLAIDDAGSGYASFLHILQLNPDIIKLDISLIRDLDTDPTRRALTAALVGFAQETDSHIVAEGVETLAELRALEQLHVHIAQGHLLGRPLPLNELAALF
ncbi:EAL domain-containing protein [Nodosilinea sp. LEGE 07088]|nr:EAL domain-containing protein [Nodosilinea sp. LEGE 07088]